MHRIVKISWRKPSQSLESTVGLEKGLRYGEQLRKKGGKLGFQASLASISFGPITGQLLLLKDFQPCAKIRLSSHFVHQVCTSSVSTPSVDVVPV